MSEFYSMPITTAKTNSSYLVPTTSQSSVFSTFSINGNSDPKEHSGKKSSFGKKVSKFFRGGSKI